MPATRLTETRQTAWFAVYYQMGPDRSLENLADYGTGLGLKLSVRTLKRYSSDFGWRARVAEMDEKARERTEERVLDQKVDMNLRHVTLAKALAGVAAGALTGHGFCLSSRPSAAAPVDRDGTPNRFLRARLTFTVLRVS